MKHVDKRRGKKPPQEKGRGVSRRGFFTTVGLAGAAAGVSRGDLLASAPSVPQGAGPEAVPVSLKINGKAVNLKVEPRVTLLDALRDHLDTTGKHVDLTGSKRVCDRASCGACTMIVDGRTIYGCSTLAIEAQGAEIRTVEGLENNGKLHPVQEEFIKHDGLMCGFCTPGFVMSGVACVEKNPNAGREEIRRCLDGNICRCGTQPRSLEAVEAAAARMKGR